MKEKHIAVFEWEPGEPLDEEHLESCPECRSSWQLRQFMEQGLEAAPEFEPPPFFAARVSQLATAELSSFWDLLQNVARRWTPLFATLALAAITLLLVGPPNEPVEDFDVRALLAPEPAEELSLEDIVLLLGELEDERFEQ